MISKCIGSQMGLTLLETMIALLIFTVGILAVASMQLNAMAKNSKARRLTLNAVAAGEYLETVLSLPYEDPLLEDPDNGYMPSHPDHGPINIGTTSSTVEWEVDDRFPVPNTKRISITVRVNQHNVGRESFTYDYIKIKSFM